jgi:nitroimidazol reductase NimA-like FMN-containing flavoprotein (pyridoxamine 5'-phosphate oxidase superfamily)
VIEMNDVEIHQLLEASRIGRLCMAGADGRPYSIPLPFCWTDGALYLRLPLTGRKGDVLRGNDRVCFEVDAFTDTLDDYASVLVEGRLIAVDDVDEKAKVQEINKTKYQLLRRGYRPGHGRSIQPTELPLRKIKVDQISGRRKPSEPVAAPALA